MECKFVAGEHIVCINVSGWFDSGTMERGKGPVPNEICKVLEVVPKPEDIYLKLAGYSDTGGFITALYSHRGFRPLQKKSTQTDISVFIEIKDKISRRELERA